MDNCIIMLLSLQLLSNHLFNTIKIEQKKRNLDVQSTNIQILKQVWSLNFEHQRIKTEHINHWLTLPYMACEICRSVNYAPHRLIMSFCQ